MRKLFADASNEQAFLKAGFMGFMGSGKTYTASILTLGLVLYLRKREVPGSDKPVYFLDTEKGSDWMVPLFKDYGVQLRVAKTRAFADLVPALREATAEGSALIIDSVSHYWKDLMDSYVRKKGRKNGLKFQDWDFLKGPEGWGGFSDEFVNAPLHITMCGRAGYEYDFFEDEETGKKEIEKTAIKMKAESETGYEPSILVLMERRFDMDKKSLYRELHFLKDRSRLLDGQTRTVVKHDDHKEDLRETFGLFLPHIQTLNLGGNHVGVQTGNSQHIIPPNEGRGEWEQRKLQRRIWIEKIGVLFAEHGISGSGGDKAKARIDALKAHFGTDSMVEVEEKLGHDRLREGLDSLHKMVRGVGLDFTPPVELPPEAPEEEPGADAGAGKVAAQLVQEAQVTSKSVARRRAAQTAEG